MHPSIATIIRLTHPLPECFDLKVSRIHIMIIDWRENRNFGEMSIFSMSVCTILVARG